MSVSSHPRKAFSLLLCTAALLLGACAAPAAGQVQPQMADPALLDPGQLTAEGSLAPLRSTILGFSAAGKLGELLVGEGQQVEQGDVLARLGDREALEAALSQALLEQLYARQALDSLQGSADLMRTLHAQQLAEAQQNLYETQYALNHLDTSEFRDELEERNDAIQDAREDLADAQEKLDRYQDRDPEDAARKSAQEEVEDAEQSLQDALYARNTWQNRLDQARSAVDVAQAQLRDSRQTYLAWQDGPDPDELAAAQARLDNAGKTVAAAQQALDNLELRAPYGGTIVEVNELEPGEIVAPGAMVVILADYSQWIVQTRDLSELDVVAVKVGQKVSVTPDALPELALTGTVEAVDRRYTERSGDILYTVHIRLEQADPALRWGMTALVTFE